MSPPLKTSVFAEGVLLQQPAAATSQGLFLQGLFLQGLFLQGLFLQGLFLQGLFLQGLRLVKFLLQMDEYSLHACLAQLTSKFATHMGIHWRMWAVLYPVCLFFITLEIYL